MIEKNCGKDGRAAPSTPSFVLVCICRVRVHWRCRCYFHILIVQSSEMKLLSASVAHGHVAYKFISLVMQACCILEARRAGTCKVVYSLELGKLTSP